MLLSMTGFGDAASMTDALNVAVEVRTVNNRYLKITSKLPDPYGPLESRVEKVVRESVARGTVQIQVRIEKVGVDRRYQLDRKVLDTYWSDLNEFAAEKNCDLGGMVPAILAHLPGAVSEDEFVAVDVDAEWPTVEQVLRAALDKLREFRVQEGHAIREDLSANRGRIAAELDRVVERAPQVVDDYRQKIYDRVASYLESADVQIDHSDLIREVGIFADRADINEEIQRLTCHLDQFETFLNDEQSLGRKLEFLSQEIFREINTIGSKANDIAIAHCVVEMKACVEKIRENLQNVE